MTTSEDEQETRALVQWAVRVVASGEGTGEGRKRVVLYVDESMVDRTTGCFLPVMNIEGDQCINLPFPERMRERTALLFGADYRAADALVAELNAENGIDKDTARDIVLATLFPGSRKITRG